MTLSPSDLALYVGALFVLFLTPGPVMLALTARGLASGFHGVWPLALGVALGDVAWSFLAIKGVAWILSAYGGFLHLMTWIAAAMFIAMGVMLWRGAQREITLDGRLTRPGIWAGFVAGLAVIIGNPKAILFYMGLLPGFFDLSALTTADIAAICFFAALVPLLGNLIVGLVVHRARALLRSPQALSRINKIAAALLILVGCIIPFT